MRTAWKTALVTSVLLTGVVSSYAAPAEFDVASIKPSQFARSRVEGSRRERVTVSPTGVILGNVSLSYCIQWAYNVKFYQVSGPDWLIQERYDIIAKVEQPVRNEQLRSMLQALLAERFHLKLRRETRNMPVYALVARQNGARLRASKPDADSGMTIADGGFVFQHMTLSEFAERLSDLSAIDRPVLDSTGIQGAFDITLKEAARTMLKDPSSIFSAIEEAGLKLESRKGPVDVLVVEHAERPSPN
jgi:uncharacterized protein (TIGR03435 family)